MLTCSLGSYGVPSLFVASKGLSPPSLYVWPAIGCRVGSNLGLYFLGAATTEMSNLRLSFLGILCVCLLNHFRERVSWVRRSSLGL